jgi:hypothetical protein
MRHLLQLWHSAVPVLLLLMVTMMLVRWLQHPLQTWELLLLLLLVLLLSSSPPMGHLHVPSCRYWYDWHPPLTDQQPTATAAPELLLLLLLLLVQSYPHARQNPRHRIAPAASWC